MVLFNCCVIIYSLLEPFDLYSCFQRIRFDLSAVYTLVKVGDDVTLIKCCLCVLLVGETVNLLQSAMSLLRWLNFNLLRWLLTQVSVALSIALVKTKLSIMCILMLFQVLQLGLLFLFKKAEGVLDIHLCTLLGRLPQHHELVLVILADYHFFAVPMLEKVRRCFISTV